MRKRFSLARRLNIGFSKKSIKRLIIKVNKYSLALKLFRDFRFPGARLRPLDYLQCSADTRARRACSVSYETEKSSKEEKLPIIQRQLY